MTCAITSALVRAFDLQRKHDNDDVESVDYQFAVGALEGAKHRVIVCGGLPDETQAAAIALEAVEAMTQLVDGLFYSVGDREVLDRAEARAFLLPYQAALSRVSKALAKSATADEQAGLSRIADYYGATKLAGYTPNALA